MEDVHPLATTWEKEHARSLHRLAVALVVVGLVWRFSRYLLAFPIWGDEAFLLVNYFTRGYADLLGPIDNCQIAPLLFHVLEMTAFRLLGPNELAVRLPAFLACLANVALFWHLARLLLPPLARTLTVAIFAVSVWPATMGALVKPYAFDLFFSLAMLVLAAHWALRPGSVRPLVVLALLAPVAMIGSYPAVFVGGSLAVVLAGLAWQRGDRRALGLVVLYGVLLSGTFVAHYLGVAVRHLASNVKISPASPLPNASTQDGMDSYWANAFPPRNPLRLAWWLFLVHTGQVAAYPLGAANGGSIATATLGLLGMIWLWRRDQRWLVLVILGIFALGFLAGWLRKYPYLLSCRLSQHLAPLYCLTAGIGLAALLLRCREGRRGWAVGITLGILALIGLGGTVRDFVRPYRELNSWTSREVVRELIAEAGDEPILVLGDPTQLEATVLWNLGKYGDRVRWCQNLPATVGQTRAVWVVEACFFGNKPPSAETQLSASPVRWRRSALRRFAQGVEVSRDPIQCGRIVRMVREESDLASAND
ncbi:MAG: glycosyltransferase family 39 protein [Gemmataceae bacterium]